MEQDNVNVVSKAEQMACSPTTSNIDIPIIDPNAITAYDLRVFFSRDLRLYKTVSRPNLSSVTSFAILEKALAQGQA